MVGFTETKTDDCDNIQIPGYVTFMKNRRKLTNTRSGGIILAVRDNIVKYIKIINTDCKYVFWFKLDKMLLNSTDDLLCGVVYIPPEGSRYASPDCFIEIEQELINITNESKCFCLMGDFNARVGHLNDFFISDDFLAHLNGCTDIFQPDIVERALVFESYNIPLKRIVQDTIVNNYGYKLIEFCKKNEVYIVNGQFGSDKNIGGYTILYRFLFHIVIRNQPTVV